MIFEPNDGVIWCWRDPDWSLVCSEITPTVVYRDATAQFFELGVINGSGRKFRLKATALFSRRPEDLRRALNAESVQVFDLYATEQYLRSTIPRGLAVDDPNIQPTPATGCHAEFRRAWMKARGNVYV